MLKRVVALAFSVGCALLVTGPVHSSPGPEDPTRPPETFSPDVGGDMAPTFETNENGGIGSRVDRASSSNEGAGGGESSSGPATFGRACTWSPANVSNMGGPALPTDVAGGTDIFAQVTNAAGDTGWLRHCLGDLAALFVWVAPAVDPIDLVPGASTRARAQLPLPSPDMNPAAEVGSVVNLGVWFAIDDPGTTTARATLASAWAQVQGTFQSVTIDPGDGADPVTCDGLGTPYPQGSNDPDQGPCGHTYLERTPDERPNQMTYTITYNLTWSTSDGRSGNLGTYDRSATFDYDIDEIQTVGTG